MVSSVTSPPLTNGQTVCNTQNHAQEDKQLLLRLEKLWKSHLKCDLEVRWKTGDLLNRRLGAPTERLAHGQQVLKKVARQLQIAESDLSRMRWFAHLFQSVVDFQEKHPSTGSWTKVKELIPGLTAAGDSDGVKSPTEEKSSGGEKDVAVIAGILRSLGSATERFRQNGFALAGAKREQMRKTIGQFLEVVGERLQLRFTIEDLETTESSTL